MRANSFIQNRWFTYYKFVGINLEMFSGMCSMIANICAIKQCYCDNKFVLWIEILRSGSSSSSYTHTFSRSIICREYCGRFIYWFSSHRKLNPNKSSNCCWICVSSNGLPDKRNVWKLDFVGGLHHRSYCSFREEEWEKTATSSKAKSEEREFIVDRRVCHYTYELMFTK